MTERDELDAMAGEYVLGLLGDEARLSFEIALMHNENAREALRAAPRAFLRTGYDRSPVGAAARHVGAHRRRIRQASGSDADASRLMGCVRLWA